MPGLPDMEKADLVISVGGDLTGEAPMIDLAVRQASQDRGRPLVARVQCQPGARLGGPIIKDKAFFFVNYEWISAPGRRTDTRTIMSPNSEKGLFQYSGGTVDLMALAARNGHASAIDPVVAKLLADVRSTTGQGAVTTSIDPLVQSFAWSQETDSTTKYPTVRLDYNITANHRVTGSGTYNHLVSDPDTTNSMQAIFPGWRGSLGSRQARPF